MRSKQIFIAAALIAGAIALPAWASAARPVVSVTPLPSVSFSTAFTTAGPDDAPDAWASTALAAANAARGAGFISWWRGHGKDVAAAIGCALDGAAIGRMVALGMAAGGGAWAAAGLAAAAIGCLS